MLSHRIQHCLTSTFLAVVLLLASQTEGLAQQSDISKLVHPEVAERLSLSEAQSVQLQQLILERATALAAAQNAADKLTVGKDFEARAWAILSAEQRDKLASDQPTQTISFQFRALK